MTDDNQLIQQCNTIISKVLGDLDAVDTTESVIDVSEYRYDTPEAKFQGFLKALNIELLSIYVNDSTSVTLHCATCGYSWDMKPYLIKRRKQCPNCKKVLKLAMQEAIIWERTVKILKDKCGKIVQRPRFRPNQAPSVYDEFVIQCHRGHTFTRSHYELRRDLWCPICPKMSTTDKLLHKVTSSRHVYGRKPSKVHRQKYLGLIAVAKGMDLLSIKQEDGKYVAQCRECEIRTRITERQLLKNRYLCHNKCTRGEIYNLSDTFFVE